MVFLKMYLEGSFLGKKLSSTDSYFQICQSLIREDRVVNERQDTSLKQEGVGLSKVSGLTTVCEIHYK
jgi:hypothetical protein